MTQKKKKTSFEVRVADEGFLDDPETCVPWHGLLNFPGAHVFEQLSLQEGKLMFWDSDS